MNVSDRRKKRKVKGAILLRYRRTYHRVCFTWPVRCYAHGTV